MSRHARPKMPAEGADEALPSASRCACGADLEPSHRFCRRCGMVTPTLRRVPPASGPEAGTGSEGEPCCASCGSPLGDASARFCRHCGHRLPDVTTAEGSRSLEEASGSPRSPGTARVAEKSGSGRCRSCGVELVPGRRFCPACGILVSSGRSADAGELRHPSWHLVADGMSRVYWGTLTLVFALVFAAAASTLINLFSLDYAEGGLQAALMGASALGVALGFALLLWGDILDLRIPSLAQGRWHALVVLLLGGGAAISGILALGTSASAGFAPDRIPSGAGLLGALALLLLVGRLVAFAALLRRLAFALRNYRIAQGSVGFILYVGVGFAVVGLLGLLFREASSSAQTFGELLGLAFVSGLALWALGMARRSRDLVRQRLA